MKRVGIVAGAERHQGSGLMAADAQTEIAQSTVGADQASSFTFARRDIIVAKAVVGAAAAGSIARVALAEDRMKQRLPRGYSIDGASSTNQRNAAVPDASANALAGIAPKDAARFLAQATMGTKKPDIIQVQGLGGYENWLNNQFTLPYPTMNVTWLFLKKFNIEQYKFDPGPFYQSNWRLMIGSIGQLRQRIVFALSNIFVINGNSLNMAWPAFAAGNFADVLQLNAFANFRTLLEKITLTSAMGSYLNMRGNYKADPSRSTEPDENYARELLQLFTIGLYELNQDGTLKLSGGKPIETYTQKDVSGLARVLTGWDCDDSKPENHRLPMKHYPDRHELGAKTFLGLTIPAGTNGPTSLKMALDHIFSHANVGPFLALGLIKRLVTSNPSPAYVTRVSSVFSNNGAGVRGDMKAVISAVLLDPEARALPASPYGGKQREEILRFTAWARALQVRSADTQWSFYIDLSQMPYRSPSVFNFFRPSYTPPQSDLSNQNLVAPEFQLTNETTVFQYINTVGGLGYGSIGPSCVASYNAFTPLARNTKALLDEVNLVIAAGQVSDARISEFAAAIEQIGISNLDGQLERVKAAITLVMTAPEFIIVK
jgi:Protein of unknown function (DUF1800)